MLASEHKWLTSFCSAQLVNLSFGLRPKMRLQIKLWSVFGFSERLLQKLT